MHKLLAHQIRTNTRENGELDIEAMLSAVLRTYEETDRERRLIDRSNRLMEEELKEANERIRKHGERRLAETLENAPCALALLDSQMKLQSANPSLLALCDTGSEESVRGMDVRALLCRATPDAGNIVDLVMAGEPVEFESRGRWYLGAASQISDGSHTISFSDITALKEREAALAIAKEAAESANRLKSQFLAVMSHELRTPLNAILGFSEIIRDAVFGTQEVAWTRYSSYASSIHDSGRHLLSLISEILDLSKIESGSYTLHPEPLDVAEILREAYGLVASQAIKDSVTLHPLPFMTDLSARADRRAVKQVILNLLSNAVKFTPPGGDVSVHIEADGHMIRVSIKDTGIGIDPENIDAVFQPFHQGDARLARNFQGTGLGLPISRALMQMHGGTIVLESEQGIGTIATIMLPRVAVITEGMSGIAA